MVKINSSYFMSLSVLLMGHVHVATHNTNIPIFRRLIKHTFCHDKRRHIKMIMIIVVTSAVTVSLSILGHGKKEFRIVLMCLSMNYPALFSFNKLVPFSLASGNVAH